MAAFVIVSFRHKANTFNDHRPATRERGAHGRPTLTLPCAPLTPAHGVLSFYITAPPSGNKSHFINSELQNSFADICSLAENNINVETFFKRLHMCQMQYLLFALFGAPVFPLSGHMWLHVVDIMVVKCRKKSSH